MSGAWITSAVLAWCAVSVLLGLGLGRVIAHRDRQIPTDKEDQP